MPAFAHTSSFSPPGAPETPTAPMTSSPTLIGRRTLRRDDPGQVDSAEGGVVLDPLDKLARGDAKCPRRVRLALTVLHRVRRGVVAAYRQEDLAVATEDVHGHAIPLFSASLESGLSNGHGHQGRQALLIEQLRGCRRRASAREAQNSEAIKHRSHVFLPLVSQRMEFWDASSIGTLTHNTIGPLQEGDSDVSQAPSTRGDSSPQPQPCHSPDRARGQPRVNSHRRRRRRPDRYTRSRCPSMRIMILSKFRAPRNSEGHDHLRRRPVID